MQKQGGNQKVNVSLTRDDQEIPVTLSYTGASEAVASPDGKQVAFIVRGEVFVTSVEYGTTKQITHTWSRRRTFFRGRQPYTGICQRTRWELAAL